MKLPETSASNCFVLSKRELSQKPPGDRPLADNRRQFYPQAMLIGILVITIMIV